MSPPRTNDYQSIALAHAARGRRVFPLRVIPTPEGGRRKVPVIPWKDEATADPDQVRRLWRNRSFNVGWALPEDHVVIDIDDRAKFDASGLDLPPTASQATLRDLGSHHLYQTDGRPVPQLADRSRGFDTRVGGKGLVGLYHDDSFAGEVAPAPDWVYELKRQRAVVADEPISSRDDILALAGHLRFAGLDGDEIATVLVGRLNDGRIYSEDDSWPWTEDDLEAIAKDIGKKPGREVVAPATVRRVKRPVEVIRRG